MRDQAPAGRSPTATWNPELDGASLGTGLLGTRLVGAARVASALHLLAERDSTRPHDEQSGVGVQAEAAR